MSLRGGQRWIGIVVLGVFLAACGDEPDVVLDVKPGDCNQKNELQACRESCDPTTCSNAADLTRQRTIAVYLDDPAVKVFRLLHLCWDSSRQDSTHSIEVHLGGESRPVRIKLHLDPADYGRCDPATVCEEPILCP